MSSALATQDQNNGTYDITAGNSVSYIQDQVSGRSNLEIVAEGSLMQPNNQALYTLPGSPLKSITELGHARIGVNATNNIGTLLFSSVLEEHGVSLRDVQFVPIQTGFPGMALALQQHLIDVAWLPEPFGSADSMKFGLQEVADLDQGATTNFPVGWYVVTKAWAKKYPGRSRPSSLPCSRARRSRTPTGPRSSRPWRSCPLPTPSRRRSRPSCRWRTTR